MYSFTVLCILITVLLTIAESAKNKRNKVKSSSTSSTPNAGKGTGQQDPAIPSVNISKWEFCEGCKVTVEAYSLASYRRMRDMQARKIPDNEILESSSLVEGICDSEPFDLYDLPMKHSCIKIFSDHQADFSRVFEGKASVLSANAPSEVFAKRRSACLNSLGICHASAFSNTVPPEERSKCRACQVIADDLEQYLRIAKKVPKKKMEQTMEEVCSKLGLNHQPFTWLEQVCEELTEERSEQIQSIKKFRDRVAATGLNPDKRLRDMICDEIYECDKPKSKNNKKPVVKKQTEPVSSSSGNGEDDNAEL